MSAKRARRNPVIRRRSWKATVRALIVLNGTSLPPASSFRSCCSVEKALESREHHWNQYWKWRQDLSIWSAKAQSLIIALWMIQRRIFREIQPLLDCTRTPANRISSGQTQYIDRDQSKGESLIQKWNTSLVRICWKNPKRVDATTKKLRNNIKRTMNPDRKRRCAFQKKTEKLEKLDKQPKTITSWIGKEILFYKEQLAIFLEFIRAACQ